MKFVFFMKQIDEIWRKKLISDLIELVGNLCLIFDIPYSKRIAKENLGWVKQQEWFLNYTNDPKWEDMLNHDKKIHRILGSYSHKKLIKDREIQEDLKNELVDHYEMWKITWKLR